MAFKTPLIFFSTFPNKKAALAFAHRVVKGKLAACVNVVSPVASVYFWEGKVHSDREFLVMGKTTASAFKKLKFRMKELHPYKTPELIALKISDGLPAYLKWLAQS